MSKSLCTKMDPRWQHPFTAIVAGPTKCGKTYFVERFISNIDQMMTPRPMEIIWCYAEWQPAYNRLKHLGVIFHEGIPDIHKWDVQTQRLCILDDLMDETNDTVTKLFTKGSHHRNISVIQIIQNLFGRNRHQRTISLNAHYIVLFKSPRDMTQILHFGKQIFPSQPKYVSESFKSATESPHGYLLFDLTQETPDHLRLRNNIFPGEQQTVYVPRKN